MYSYKAKIIKVHDGDTVTAEVDLGFRIKMEMPLRLYGPNPLVDMGFNAPELNTEEGKQARDFLKQLIDACGGEVAVHTVKDKKEKYGRYLAVLYPSNGVSLNQQMIDAGHAKLEKY